MMLNDASNLLLVYYYGTIQKVIVATLLTMLLMV